MHLSRVWTCGLFIVAWLCCSSLLIGAQKPVTSPEEGDFTLVFCSFAFHESQASFAIKCSRGCLFRVLTCVLSDKITHVRFLLVRSG